MIKPERIISVDFLRGLTVACMILVNNPGSWEHIYSPLRHASWNGCTPTDLVFPFFLFIVGISISYSLSTVKQSGENKSKLYLKIIKRSLILFALGLFLNIGLDFEWATFRIPGVLQRISIVFLVSAIVFLTTSVRTQVIMIISVLAGYCVLLTCVAMPGVGAANLEPGTNLSAWLDRTLLGEHVWKYAKTWDPEGTLSTLPAISSGLLGVLAGTWLRSDKEKKDKLIMLFVAGNLLILSGLYWGLFFPINKSIWSSSFVLYTTGIALNGLAISYWLLDVISYKKYTSPFLAFGSNAIAAYMLSELLAKITYSITIGEGEEQTDLKGAIFQALKADWMNPEFLSFVLAISWVVLIWVVIDQLYRRKIFIKV